MKLFVGLDVISYENEVPLEDLANYLKVQGKNRFPDPEYVAKSILKAVRSSYRLDKVVEDSIDTISMQVFIGVNINLVVLQQMILLYRVMEINISDIT